MSRILIVEDHPMNRLLVTDVLAHRGHEIIEACTVAEALVCLREKRPEIVLLDLQIPGGGGEAVLRSIRAEPTQASIPVIAVTAFAMSGDRARLLASGFDGYISKPINTLTFGSEIEDFIGKSSP